MNTREVHFGRRLVQGDQGFCDRDQRLTTGISLGRIFHQLHERIDQILRQRDRLEPLHRAGRRRDHMIALVPQKRSQVTLQIVAFGRITDVPNRAQCRICGGSLCHWSIMAMKSMTYNRER